MVTDRKQRLPEQHRQQLLLLSLQPLQQFVLLFDVAEDHRVDRGSPGIGQVDQSAAPVRRIRPSLDKPGHVHLIDLIGNRARRQHQRVRQRLVGRLGASPCPFTVNSDDGVQRLIVPVDALQMDIQQLDG